MMKQSIFTQNPISQQILSYNTYKTFKHLYQSKLDYLTFPAILIFSMKHLNTIKISQIYLGMTTDLNINRQITNVKTKLNRPKLAKETSSGSIHFFQNSPTSVNISFFQIQTIFPNNHKYHKISNKTNLKVSYSCMANIKSIISTYREVTTGGGGGVLGRLGGHQSLPQ